MAAATLNAYAAEKVIEFQTFEQEQEGEFIKIEVRGCRYTTLEQTGEKISPRLPYVDIQFNIPENVGIEDIFVDIISKKEMSLSKKILPAKKWEIIGEKKSLPNEEIYDSEKIYPEKIFHLLPVMKVHGGKIATVRIFPIQYFPKENKIIFVKKIIINFPDFSIEKLSRAYPHLLIISSQKIIESGALQDYVLNRELIYSLHLKTVNWISENYEGRDIQEKMRSCIKEYYDLYGAIYVLALGDKDIIPIRLLGDGIILRNFASDWYYSCLDGTWDGNENNIFGEYLDDIDMIPEIFFGRIPISTSEQVKIYLSSIMNFEQNSEPKFLGLGCEDENMPGLGRVGIEAVLKFVPNCFAVGTIFQDETPEYAQRVIDMINANSITYMAHIDHGDYWRFNCGGNKIVLSDIANLYNTKPIFVNTVSCLTAMMPVDNYIAKQFFTNPNGVIATYIGNTSFGISPFSDQELLPKFFEIWFSDSLTLGQAFNEHKVAFLAEMNSGMRFCILELTLLGDPTIKRKKHFYKGDFDLDGDVDGSDLAMFMTEFNRTNCATELPCNGDFNLDGKVDGSDLIIFATNFGQTTTN